MPGVERVWPNVAYRPLLDRSPGLIGAPQMWSVPSFSTAGNGIKIGIIDDGVDQAHPFFNPAGYTMPPGFPKGNTAYTSAKVIAARAFPAPETSWQYAKLPFDPKESEHATHVAGIAAGDYSPNAIAGRGPLSGVARTRTSATTRSSRIRRRTLASTATHPRSPPGSRRRSRMAWT
jgi:subtilisin family serine protease